MAVKAFENVVNIVMYINVDDDLTIDDQVRLAQIKATELCKKIDNLDSCFSAKIQTRLMKTNLKSFKINKNG